MSQHNIIKKASASFEKAMASQDIDLTIIKSKGDRISYSNPKTNALFTMFLLGYRSGYVEATKTKVVKQK